MWSDRIKTLIRDKCENIDYLKSMPPIPPENNDLRRDNITLDQITMRENFDKSVDYDNPSAVAIMDNIVLGSHVKPIPQDTYTDYEIQEWKEYLEEMDEWRKKTKNENYPIFFADQDNPISTLTPLYSKGIERIVLVLFSNYHEITILGIEEHDNISNGTFSARTFNFYKPTLEQLNDYLDNIDFQELGKRLKANGYKETYDEILEELDSL